MAPSRPLPAAHARLAGLVGERWRVDFQQLQAAVAPHVSQAAIQPAEADFARMALEYEGIWKAQLDKELRAVIQDQNVVRRPGRAWRRGLGHAAAAAAEPPDGPAPLLYPARPEPVALSSSTRRKEVWVARASGEEWPHPGDPEDLWPGISASLEAAGTPHPGFGAGGFDTKTGQPWMPLARRVDLDRVLPLMLESCCFKDVQPTGSNGHLYKVDPWNHMNPYLIRATYTFHDADGAHRGAVKVGVTDHWKNKSCGHVSTSGAKVYAQGSPGVAAGALGRVRAPGGGGRRRSKRPQRRPAPRGRRRGVGDGPPGPRARTAQQVGGGAGPAAALPHANGRRPRRRPGPAVGRARRERRDGGPRPCPGGDRQAPRQLRPNPLRPPSPGLLLLLRVLLFLRSAVLFLFLFWFWFLFLFQYTVFLHFPFCQDVICSANEVFFRFPGVVTRVSHPLCKILRHPITYTLITDAMH